jgi:hypothetical protein
VTLVIYAAFSRWRCAAEVGALSKAFAAEIADVRRELDRQSRLRPPKDIDRAQRAERDIGRPLQ